MRTDANDTVEVKRATLYEEVWSEPLTLLGPRYGLSDVGLARLCDRLLIPRPGVGYWAKLEHGKAPPRPPLPPAVGGAPEVVCFPIEPKFNVPIEEVPVVTVRKRLTNPHPLIRKAADALAHSKPDRMHGLVSPGPGHLAIRVTPALERRALRAFDALAKAIEARGAKLEVREYWGKWSTAAVFADQPVSFRMRERLREVSREAGTYGDRVTLKPKGELAVEIDSYAASGLRKRWGDTPRRSLEEQLGRCVVTMEAIARIEREVRLRRDEEQRQAEKRRQEEAEKRRSEELEAARIRRLRELAADWRSATDIRSFVEAVEACGETKTQAFIKWALCVAEELDPSLHIERLEDLSSVQK